MSRFGGMLGQRLLDPSEHAGLLVARFEATSGIAVADGAAVDVWTGGIGGISARQATGTKQPIYHADDGDGYPVVQFDGVDDNLLLDALNLGPDLTLMALAKVGGASFPQGVCALDAGSGNANRVGYIKAIDANTFQTREFVGTGGGSTVTGTAFETESATVANWNIVTMVRRATTGFNAQLYVNSASNGSSGLGGGTALPTSTGAQMVMGAGQSGTIAQYLQGKIRVLYVYAGQLSDADRVNDRRYIARHWPGFSSLT